MLINATMLSVIPFVVVKQLFILCSNEKIVSSPSKICIYGKGNRGNDCCQ